MKRIWLYDIAMGATILFGTLTVAMLVVFVATWPRDMSFWAFVAGGTAFVLMAVANAFRTVLHMSRQERRFLEVVQQEIGKI